MSPRHALSLQRVVPWPLSASIPWIALPEREHPDRDTQRRAARRGWAWPGEPQHVVRGPAVHESWEGGGAAGAPACLWRRGRADPGREAGACSKAIPAGMGMRQAVVMRMGAQPVILPAEGVERIHVNDRV